MPIFKAPNNDTFKIDRDDQLDGLPPGCVVITEQELLEILASRTTTVLSHQEMASNAMLSMKSKRLDIFRVLDTLQVDALTSSDQPRAQAIMQAKAALTALNAIDLSAYQTAEQMEQAIQLAYWGIVSQAPQAVQDAFNALVPR